jgi:hypothetical protein
MNLKTPVHTDHQLDQLAGEFAHWRQHRSHPSERIPQALWDQATALAMVLPYSHVAKYLRLSPRDLKKQVLAQQGPTSRAPAPVLSFIEVPPAPEPFMTRPGTEIELQRADGACLRLRSCESTLTLAAVVRAFLEAS